MNTVPVLVGDVVVFVVRGPGDIGYFPRGERAVSRNVVGPVVVVDARFVEDPSRRVRPDKSLRGVAEEDLPVFLEGKFDYKVCVKIGSSLDSEVPATVDLKLDQLVPPGDVRLPHRICRGPCSIVVLETVYRSHCDGIRVLVDGFLNLAQPVDHILYAPVHPVDDELEAPAVVIVVARDPVHAPVGILHTIVSPPDHAEHRLGGRSIHGEHAQLPQIHGEFVDANLVVTRGFW